MTPRAYLLHGDARALPLRTQSVQCVVTSPPYWGLRDYGIGGQLGLESTPDAYVSALVAIFREVWRVLADDGTVWLNLGDSYSGSGKGGNPDDGKQATNKGSQSIGVLYGKTGESAREAALTNVSRIWTAEAGIRRKQLIGIPWRVAFALQADGWYLRSDIIWSKPNPMPESVTDRPTKSHEYVFLLTKAERYYYDAQAIAEPVSAAMLLEMEQGYDGLGLKDYDGAGVQNPSSVKARIIANARSRHMANTPRNDGERWRVADGGVAPRGLGRNHRSVWVIPTSPYPDAHFATFPPKLIEPCILAGTRPGDLVLDPFVGSGTTCAVALKLGRSAIGVDLNPAYLALASRRIRVTPGLPLEVA